MWRIATCSHSYLFTIKCLCYTSTLATSSLIATSPFLAVNSTSSFLLPNDIKHSVQLSNMSSISPTVPDDLSAGIASTAAAPSALQNHFSDHTKETRGSGKRLRARTARKPGAPDPSAYANVSKTGSASQPDPSTCDAQTTATGGGESAQTGEAPSSVQEETGTPEMSPVELKILRRAKDKHDKALQLLKDSHGSWQAYSKWLTAYRNEIRTKSLTEKLSGAQLGSLFNRYDGEFRPCYLSFCTISHVPKFRIFPFSPCSGGPRDRSRDRGLQHQGDCAVLLRFDL